MGLWNEIADKHFKSPNFNHKTGHTGPDWLAGHTGPDWLVTQAPTGSSHRPRLARLTDPDWLVSQAPTGSAHRPDWLGSQALTGSSHRPDWLVSQARLARLTGPTGSSHRFPLAGTWLSCTCPSVLDRRWPALPLWLVVSPLL